MFMYDKFDGIEKIWWD